MATGQGSHWLNKSPNTVHLCVTHPGHMTKSYRFVSFTMHSLCTFHQTVHKLTIDTCKLSTFVCCLSAQHRETISLSRHASSTSFTFLHVFLATFTPGKSTSQSKWQIIKLTHDYSPGEAAIDINNTRFYITISRFVMQQGKHCFVSGTYSVLFFLVICCNILCCNKLFCCCIFFQYCHTQFGTDYAVLSQIY